MATKQFSKTSPQKPTNPRAVRGIASFESGGTVSKADQLMAEMAAKYGIAGIASPGIAQPPQQPAPLPQPKREQMQQQGIMGGIVGALKGRQQQIDKAAGYANGGKISGPGTPTSDSIPAKIRETGEDILVSNRERIISADQEKALQHIAQAQGFDSVDSMLERMTGKPVGPTIKSTTRAAADGLSPETDPDTDGRRQYSPNYGDTFANRSASAPDFLKSITAQQGSLAVGKPEDRQVSGEHAPSSNPASAGIARPPLGRNEQGVITTESAKGILAEPMRRSGGIAGAIDMVGANGILARENRARGEMIDSSIRANGGNGIGILGDGGVAADNAEKTARWRQDELLSKARSNPAAGQVAATLAHNQGITDAETIRQKGGIEQRGILAGIDEYRRSGIEQRAADRNQIQMRGQDLTAATAADRMASQERIADQRTQDAGTRLTLPQRRSNFEIDAARERVAGMDPTEIKRKTANYTATGRENPEYDPTLAKAVSLANRRKYGADDHFDQREQAQQAGGTDGDVMTRFRGDAGMKGHKTGQMTDQGLEVFDVSGRLIGHYH